MAFEHGIKTRQVETSVSTPVTALSGITFAVGAAPAHIANGKINQPVIAHSYAEAVAALGYSNNWDKYNLCEVMYTHFKLYKVSPVIFINVLDPTKHKKETAQASYPVVDKKVLLPLEALKSTVTVETYVVGTDFDLFYEGENLVLGILESGTIPEGTATLSVGFTEIDPSAVTKDEIIGGFDIDTKQSTGLELIDSVFPKFNIVPDIIICPGWSHNSEVAAVMDSKAQSINGIFEGKALIDVDTSTVTHYADAPQWKKSNNINSKYQVICFPMCKLGDRIFHMSTQLAGLMATVDIDSGNCPCESPSNKSMQIDGIVLKDGTEVILDIQQANFLNSSGIATAINFTGGFKFWGNETSCFPSSTDVKDYFISVSRMFGWVANSVILTYWSKLDKRLNRRLVDSIVDSLNIWFNGLRSEEKILGGRVEFRDEENSLVSLMAGKAVFHIYMTPASPAKELDFVLEYDANYLTTALSS